MLELRPHHILDIVRNVGNGRAIAPHEYGHNLHLVTESIVANVDQPCALVGRNDDICGPCAMLSADRSCRDVLRQLAEPVSKQDYNDALDRRIFCYLSLEPGAVLSVRAFLELARADIDGIVRICTHPKEDPESRKRGLILGMAKLGILASDAPP